MSRDAERTLATEQLDALHHLGATMTALAERWAGQVINHVLSVETVKFDANATPITRNFAVAAGGIAVTTAANNVTVSTSGPGGSTPTTGVGVFVVPKNAINVAVALASREFTLYGTAGDVISFQVFTSAVRPVAG